MRNLKTVLSLRGHLKMTVLLLLCTLTLILYTSPVYACHLPADRGADSTPPLNSGPCPAGLKQIEDIFVNVISVIVGLGFIAMLVMLVMAGIKYLTSGGEPKAIQSAHQTVTWALLGVVLMAIAWLILQLIKNFTGIDVTMFNIKALCGVATTAGFPFCK